MRYLFTIVCLVMFAGLVTADDKKARAPIEPIKIVKLDRKEPVTYDKDVEPILINKCHFCHSGPIKEAKLDMGTFETLMKGGKRGESASVVFA